MDSFLNSSAGAKMLKKDLNTLKNSAAWLVLAFCLYSIFVYVALTLNDMTIRYMVLLFAIIALFVSIFSLHVHQCIRQSREVSRLKAELTNSKDENVSLVRELEDNIEKRVYELQKVNGALNREIAERIQAENEVRELEKQLSLILNSAGEGILGVDNTGKVTFLNSAASLMLGWSPEEIIGKKHHSLIHHTLPDGSPHPVDQCPIYMAYRDGLVHFKTGDVFWSKNGTSFPVEYSSTPINDQGMLTGAVVVFRDMSTFS